MFIFKKRVNLNHKGTVNIETNRFILRRFCADDVRDVFDNWASDKESTRYNAWSIHKSTKDTAAYIDEWVKRYSDEKYYHWAITNRYTGEVIGSISVSNVKDKQGSCEVGYTVARKYWNNGIATECLIRVIEFLTEEIGFKCISAMHDVRNKASGRVMEKAGMKYVKRQKQFFLNSASLVMDCKIYEFKTDNVRTGRRQLDF